MPAYYWCQKDEEILRELWENPNVSKEDLTRVFPTRTWGGIEKKATRLSLGKRTVESQVDLEYLKKLREIVKG